MSLAVCLKPEEVVAQPLFCSQLKPAEGFQKDTLSNSCWFCSMNVGGGDHHFVRTEQEPQKYFCLKKDTIVLSEDSRNRVLVTLI